MSVEKARARRILAQPQTTALPIAPPVKTAPTVDLQKAAQRWGAHRPATSARRSLAGSAQSWLAVQGAAPETAIEYVFADRGGGELRFTELGGGKFSATLKLQDDAEPIAMELEDRGGDLCSRGGELRLTRTTGECVLELGADGKRTLRLTTDAAPFKKLQHRLLAPHLARKLSELSSDPALNDHHKNAAFSIAGLEEGRWSKLAFLDELARERSLTAADARTAPLIYAHLGTSGAALRENLARIAKQWAGSPEGRILKLGLEQEARVEGSNALKSMVLEAAIKAAADAIHDPPADEAAIAQHVLAGHRWAVATDNKTRPLQETTVLALAQSCLDQVERLLPKNHVARRAMAPFDRSAPVVRELRESSICGLRIGRLRYALEQGEMPPDFPAGSRSMPDLSLQRVLSGAMLKKFDAEILAKAELGQISQGVLENCYYVAAWASAVERRPEIFAERAQKVGDRVKFSLHIPDESGALVKKEELLDPIFYVDTSENLFYAGEPAMALAEKAFAYLRRDKSSYDSTSLGTGAEGFQAIFGTKNVTRSPLGRAKNGAPLEDLAAEIKNLVTCKIPATAGTIGNPALFRDTKLTPGHAYVLRELRKTANGWEVELTNMQRDVPKERATTTTWFDATHARHRPIEEERRAHDQIKNPGELTISLADFDRLFGHIDSVSI